jgi:hypothetical protein
MLRSHVHVFSHQWRSSPMHRIVSACGAAVAFAITHVNALQAQSALPLNAERLITDVGATHAAQLEQGSGSHRVRTAGIVGGAIGLTAGVVGSSIMGFRGDASSAARGATYLAMSGAVVGWIVGTTVVLPFHGRNVVGPNDLRNATTTGGVVGFMTGVAAGSLMTFKCANGCSAAKSPLFTIAIGGLVGGFTGAAIGNGVGMALPH